MRKSLRFEIAHVLSNIFGVLLITATVLFVAATPFSCKVTDSGIEVDSADEKAPEIQDFSVESSSCASVRCSVPFSLSDLAMTSSSDGAEYGIDAKSVSFDESRSTAKIFFPLETETGKTYTLSGVISDAKGNSLKFSKDFIGFNDNQAFLVLKEVRPASENTKKKAAYLSFHALKGGNLAGTEVLFGYYNTKYAFPAITVSAGETIVLHLRSYGDAAEGYVDELGSNLSLSSAFESSPTARDLWIPGTELYLSGTSDVVAVVNTYKDSAFDGLLYIKESGKSWSRNNQKSLAALLASSGVWKNDSPESAVVTGISSAAKSIQRNDLAELVASFSGNVPDCISSEKIDWSIGSATLGK